MSYAEEMFEFYRDGFTTKKIGEKYGCTRQNISLIFRDKFFEEYTWIVKTRLENRKPKGKLCSRCKKTYFSKEKTPKFCSIDCYLDSFGRLTDEEKRARNRERVKRYFKTSAGKEALLRTLKKQKEKPDYHKKQNARAKLNYNVGKGNIIKPNVCENCSRTTKEVSRIEAHHHDYDKPLDVNWLCPPCHYSVEKSPCKALK